MHKLLHLQHPSFLQRLLQRQREIEDLGGQVVVAPDVETLLHAAPADAVLLIDNLLASGRRALKAPSPACLISVAAWIARA